jgi:hypothetical protein
MKQRKMVGTLFGAGTVAMALGAMTAGYGALLGACSSDDASGDGSDAGAARAPDATSDAQLAEVDAGACVPTGAAPRTGPYAFASNGSGACTSAQLSALFATCLGDAGTSAGCAAFSAANASCYGCASGPSTSTLLTPVLTTALADGTSFSWANTAGCLQALDPAQAACAQAQAVADTCEYDQCGACTQADLAGALSSCVNDAVTGSCAPAQVKETACDDQLMATDLAAAPCFDLYNADGTFTPALLSYVALVCGPPDAGAPGDGGDGGT